MNITTQKKRNILSFLAKYVSLGLIFFGMGLFVSKKYQIPIDFGLENNSKQKYLEYCSQQNLTPTNTITLALGDDVLHKEFKRGDYARICISEDIS